MKRFLAAVILAASFLGLPYTHAAYKKWNHGVPAHLSCSVFDKQFRAAEKADKDMELALTFVNEEAAKGNVLASYFQLRDVWKQLEAGTKLPDFTNFTHGTVRFLMLLAHDVITAAVVTKNIEKYMHANNAYTIFRQIIQYWTSGIFIQGCTDSLPEVVYQVSGELKEKKKDVAVPVCWTAHVAWKHWVSIGSKGRGYTITEVDEKEEREFTDHVVMIRSVREVVSLLITRVFSRYATLAELLASDDIIELAKGLCDYGLVPEMKAYVNRIAPEDEAKEVVASEVDEDSYADKDDDSDEEGDDTVTTPPLDKGLPKVEDAVVEGVTVELAAMNMGGDDTDSKQGGVVAMVDAALTTDPTLVAPTVEVTVQPHAKDKDDDAVDIPDEIEGPDTGKNMDGVGVTDGGLLRRFTRMLSRGRGKRPHQLRRTQGSNTD